MPRKPNLSKLVDNVEQRVAKLLKVTARNAAVMEKSGALGEREVDRSDAAEKQYEVAVGALREGINRLESLIT